MHRNIIFKIKLFAAQVMLDGELVALPLHDRKSLRTIRQALESEALKRERVLVSLLVDGVPVSLQSVPAEVADFRFVAGRTVSIDFLGLELLVAARRQVMDLIERARLSALQVLINPPAGGRRLWQKLRLDLREPLLTLSFLPEIGQVSSAGIPVLVPSLISLVDELNSLGSHMEMLADGTHDVYALSAGFDLVACWLENLMEAILRARNLLYAVSFE